MVLFQGRQHQEWTNLPVQHNKLAEARQLVQPRNASVDVLSDRRQKVRSRLGARRQRRVLLPKLNEKENCWPLLHPHLLRHIPKRQRYGLLRT